MESEKSFETKNVSEPTSTATPTSKNAPSAPPIGIIFF